ncbi:protein arginine kinase [bacterium]|nr:protein arginine kinase [bacterium]
MNFDSLVFTLPDWLNPVGPESNIVVSSRARLARNIAGIPYAHRASGNDLEEVVGTVLESSHAAGFSSSDFFKNEGMEEYKKDVFIERHLMSPALARRDGNRGVLVKDGEHYSIMINEEDHLRLQSLRSGLDLMEALEGIDGIDDALSKGIRFSYSASYGYLTACPTNFGTGLRASILIHLPALVLTKEIQRVIRSVGQLGLAVRGYHGEGSDVIGNFFQISNQTSLGKSEREIVTSLTSVVNQIIDYERRASQVLKKEAKGQVEDKIWRSLGILKTARVLSTHEFMNLHSAVRFGLYLEILNKPSIKTLNELMVLVQPGHIQARLGKETEPMERDVIRAEIVRQRFVDVTI